MGKKTEIAFLLILLFLGIVFVYCSYQLKKSNFEKAKPHPAKMGEVLPIQYEDTVDHYIYMYNIYAGKKQVKVFYDTLNLTTKYIKDGTNVWMILDSNMKVICIN
jgi:hypothetical protein